MKATLQIYSGKFHALVIGPFRTPAGGSECKICAAAFPCRTLCRLRRLVGWHMFHTNCASNIRTDRMAPRLNDDRLPRDYRWQQHTPRGLPVLIVVDPTSIPELPLII